MVVFNVIDEDKEHVHLPFKRNFLWAFFSSVKLTITTLVLVVLIFIAATLLTPDVVQTFAGRLSPEAAKVFFFLKLSDLYHSPIFYFLMMLLSLNLVICSVNRFPLLWGQFKALPFPEPQGIFDNESAKPICVEGKDLSKIKIIVRSCLGKRYGTIKESASEKGQVLYAEKGRFSLFGVYIVHLSVLVLIAGAVIGSALGLEADVNIGEGASVSEVNLAGGQGDYPLNFSIRCDKFIVEFYEDGTPKTYRSDLSFIRNGKIERQGHLLVNHPLQFDKFRIYQASYGLTSDARAVIHYRMDGKKGGSMTLAAGAAFELPGDRGRGVVLRVEENIMQLGPAAKIRITAPGKDIQFWVFQQLDRIIAANPHLLRDVPLFNPGLFSPFVFSLDRIEQSYYTGLHLVHDPGVPFVAAGAILMIAGMIMVFFLSYRRYWIRIEQAGAHIRIMIGGRSNRNKKQLQMVIDELHGKICEEIKA